MITLRSSGRVKLAGIILNISGRVIKLSLFLFPPSLSLSFLHPSLFPSFLSFLPLSPFFIPLSFLPPSPSPSLLPPSFSLSLSPSSLPLLSSFFSLLHFVLRALRPDQFVNQFPCEHVLTCKDLLATVAKRANQIGASPQEVGVATHPKWLPQTFNLLYELPHMVRCYFEREKQ